MGQCDKQRHQPRRGVGVEPLKPQRADKARHCSANFPRRRTASTTSSRAVPTKFPTVRTASPLPPDGPSHSGWRDATGANPAVGSTLLIANTWTFGARDMG